MLYQVFFLIVIIIGGILSGYFTPTEASGVAVVYAFILAVFVYKSIRIKDIPRILKETAVMTAIVMLIIGASSVLSFVLSFTGLPQAISAALLGVSDNKIVILLIINLILLIVGTFMDMAPALLIFTPIFFPVVKALGMNPIQFGVMMVLNLAIGTLYASGGRGAVRGLYHRQNIHGKVNKITVSVLCSDAGSADAGNFCTRGGFVYTEFAFKIRRRWNYDR